MASEVSKHDTIEIEKTQFWPSPREGCRVNALIMDYTSAKGRRLFGTCVEEDVELLEKTAGIGEARTGLMYSDAHGQSLRLDEPPFSVTRQTDDGLVYEVPTSTVLDVQNDVFVLFWLRRWIKDLSTTMVDAKKFQQVFHRISRDGGQTWEEDLPLVQHGPQYDRKHWARGVWFGRNGGYICTATVQLKNGTILAPLQVWPWDEKKQRHTTRKECAVFIGTWDVDRRRIEWELGDYIRPREQDGSLCELAIAELEDGSILGIMRASPSDGPGKICCLSRDGGRTWSEPRRLTYDDGGPLYSPSSIPRLIRNSRSGKLYFIGNILPPRADMYADMPGNLQRSVLQIAEINEDNCGIKKQTMAVIDESKDPERPREYSNFGVYEDRDSGNFVLTMCEACGLPLKWEGARASYRGPWRTKESATCHSYKYEIKF